MQVKKWAGLLFISLLMQACAISPQALNLNPSITTVGQKIGQGRTLNLKVVDTRETKLLGSRGGIYSDTAVLTIAGGPEEAIRQELAGALSGYGFVIVSEPADLTLTVEVETLSYQTFGKKYPLKIKTHLILRAISQQNNSEFSSRYAAHKEKEVLTSPTANQNEKMINNLVSRGLSQLVSDQQLMNFLSQ